MINRTAKMCPACGAPLKLKRSRRRVLSGFSRSQKNKRRLNPNFNREYAGCTANRCDYFNWTEPQATGDPKVAASTPEKLVAGRGSKVRAKGPTTKRPTKAQERRALAVAASAAEAEARAEKLRMAARGVINPPVPAAIKATITCLIRARNQTTNEERSTVAEQHASRVAAVGEEARGLAEIRAREEKEKADARETERKKLVAASIPMDADAARAMFGTPSQ